MPRREGGGTTSFADGGMNDVIDVAATETNDDMGRNKSEKKKEKTRRQRRCGRFGNKTATRNEGEDDCLTPTQLRNARKRRAKQRKRALEEGGPSFSSSSPPSNSSHFQQPQPTSASTSATSIARKRRRKSDAAGEGGTGNERRPSSAAAAASNARIGASDPSMRYLRDPLKAPVVREARAFFETYLSEDANKHVCKEKGGARTDSTHRFRVTVGPKRRWRTVSKLPVRRSSNDGEGGGGGGVEIGLFQPGSHLVVPASGSTCPAHHPSINAAVSAVRDACRVCDVEAYDEADGSGKLRYVAVNVERATGNVQLTLVWNSRPPPLTPARVEGDGTVGDAGMDNNEEGTRRLERCGDRTLVRLVRTLINLGEHDVAATVKRVKSKKRKRTGRNGSHHDLTEESSPPPPKLHSLWVHFNDAWRHSNAIFGRGENSWLLAHGPRYIHERIDDIVGCPYPVTLPFSPNVFRQANLDAFACIVARIRARLERHASSSESCGRAGGKSNRRRPRRHLPPCVELYAGIGTIGLHVADLFSSIVLSDENPHNVGCFEEAVRLLPEDIRRNVSYVPKSAEAMVRDGALSGGGGVAAAPDVCIVDPPRKGLDSTVVDALLAKHGPKLLVYVSCGFSAFRRDCGRLTASGGAVGTTTGGGRAGGTNGGVWRLEHAEGFLLFPGADAVETLAFFVRD